MKYVKERINVLMDERLARYRAGKESLFDALAGSLIAVMVESFIEEIGEHVCSIARGIETMSIESLEEPNGR